MHATVSGRGTSSGNLKSHSLYPAVGTRVLVVCAVLALVAGVAHGNSLTVANGAICLYSHIQSRVDGFCASARKAASAP